MSKTKMNLNDPDHQLIIAAMTNLVDRGMSPREVLELLEDIKRQTFHALMEIGRESQKK